MVGTKDGMKTADEEHARMNDATAPSQGNSAGYPIAIAVVVTVGFFLRLIFMTGPIGSDDTRYLEFANYFVSFTPFSYIDHAGGRLLFLFLIGIPNAIGGHAIYAAIANVCYSLVTDLMLVLFCWKTLGRRASLIAAIIMAVNPINIIYPGMILPDTLLTLFLVASGILLYYAQQDARLKNRYVKFACSGALACFAYMCKDPGILMLPIVGVFFFFVPFDGRLRERLIAPLLFFAGFFVVFFLDGLVYYAYTGDLFYKITATTVCHNQDIPHLGIAGFLQTTFDNFVDTFKRGTFFLVPLHLGLPVMFLASMVDRRTRILSCIGLFILLYLIFGSSSLSALIPLPFQVRYFQPVIPFVAIAAGVLVTRYSLFSSRVAQVLVPSIVACLIALNGASEVFLLAGTQYKSNLMKSFRTAVEVLADERQPLYVDPALHYNAQHFLQSTLYHRLLVIPESGPLKKGYYFIDTEVSSLPHDRIEKITRLKLKLRVALDWRIANQYRHLSESRYLAQNYMRVVFVYENDKDDEEGDQKSGQQSSQERMLLQPKKDVRCLNRM
jgi:hypothetical protein